VTIVDSGLKATALGICECNDTGSYQAFGCAIGAHSLQVALESVEDTDW